jgi:hypothetical protein
LLVIVVRGPDAALNWLHDNTEVVPEAKCGEIFHAIVEYEEIERRHLLLRDLLARVPENSRFGLIKGIVEGSLYARRGSGTVVPFKMLDPNHVEGQCHQNAGIWARDNPHPVRVLDHGMGLN